MPLLNLYQATNLIVPTICVQSNVLDVLLYKKSELQPGLKYKRPGLLTKLAPV